MPRLRMASRTYRTIVAALVVASLTGCTHRQLTRSTVLTTSTVMDIQYRTVLMNLAMMSCHPEALPSHADLADGVVQVNDRLGIGQNGGFSTFTGGEYGFGLAQFGPSGQRQVTEQWGADATTDPQRLTELQDLYRVALGLQPLPPPNAIAYLRQQQAEEGATSGDQGKAENKDKSGNGGKEDKSKNGGGGKDGPKDEASGYPPLRVFPSAYLAHPEAAPSATSTGGGGSTPSSSGGSSGGGNKDRRAPIEVLLSDVPPPGWFHFGGKKDVPENACYVGHCEDRYAWVMADGIPALSRFTVTVLSVVKLKTGEAGKSHGLATTTP